MTHRSTELYLVRSFPLTIAVLSKKRLALRSISIIAVVVIDGLPVQDPPKSNFEFRDTALKNLQANFQILAQ